MTMDLAVPKEKVENTDIRSRWRDHVQNAVKGFLKTAVVIDNMPYINNNTHIPAAENKNQADAFGEGEDTLEEPEAIASSTHHLDVRRISDEFASLGIACAFVLPDDNDTDDAAKIDRALSAARVSDLVVIDWYLKDKDESLTLQILESIARSDRSENGRLRLICVYTGQPLDNAIFDEVKKFSAQGGLNVEDLKNYEYCASNENALIVLLNKGDVPPEALPTKLIDLFSCLTDGLIPAFALAGVGAIRRNTHHMLTRFMSILDSAYISNRLITNPPGDVAELMRELLVAECDNALGLDRIADDYLEREAISLWLDANSEKIKYANYSAGKIDVKLSRSMIDGLLNSGVGDKTFRDSDGQEIPLPEFRRNRISESLSGDRDLSRIAENEFSRLVTFRREAYGKTTRLINPEWRPSLTTGTVLKIQDNDVAKYLMCFTPACDALRLDKVRPFVFLEGVLSDSPYNSVFIEDGGESVGVYFDKKYPVVKTFEFTPDAETQRVRAERVSNGERISYRFKSHGKTGIDFEWLGEIRYSRAASEVASLANVWMRIGILDSEYLRLATKGHFKFSG